MDIRLSATSAIGYVILADIEAYQLDTLPLVIQQLREAQQFLELRYALLRKQASEHPAPPARPAKAAAPANQPARKRGRPAGRANGHAADAPSPPLPLEDATHGEQTAQQG